MRRLALAPLAALLCLASVAAAQPANTPATAFVYPAGARQGATLRVTVGGRALDAASAAYVSGTGVRATVVATDKPLDAKHLDELRQKVEALRGEKSPESRNELRELRRRIADEQRRKRNPSLAEHATLEVTVAADAQPGPRQLRLATPSGLSNPLLFVVGQLPEFVEPEKVVDPQDADGAPEETPEISPPVTANGRLVPRDDQSPGPKPPGWERGDVDRYRFRARKGQELVLSVSARELRPYLADAVPGWVQAVLTLFDADGREVAYDDDFHCQPDPVIHYRVPADGAYTVELRDALFRGREDFVYRLSVGELPFVTGVFPLGGRVGEETTLEVAGWNLPAKQVSLSGAQAGTHLLVVQSGALSSNAVPVLLDTLPEAREREPNDSQKQALTLPVIVNGRIGRVGDVDWYQFRGRAGETVVAEVTARRAGSPLDSVIELTDAAGKRLAFNDDADDRGAGLVTHQADSRLSATLPAAGLYLLRIGDRQHKGGPEFAYRLRLSEPRPDFELRVVPAEATVPTGSNATLTVVALRKDGFNDDIELALDDAPPGFALGGAVIPGGQDRIRVTLFAPPDAAASQEPFELWLEGRARIDGRPVTRRAVAAEEMTQAFAYKHLVPSDALWVTVTNKNGFKLPMKRLGGGGSVLKIPLGGSAKLRVFLPPRVRELEELRFEASEPPEGIAVASELKPDRTEAEITVSGDAARARVGLRGNLILVLTGERVPKPDQPEAARQRNPQGSPPAIPFEVVPGN